MQLSFTVKAGNSFGIHSNQLRERLTFLGQCASEFWFMGFVAHYNSNCTAFTLSEHTVRCSVFFFFMEEIIKLVKYEEPKAVTGHRSIAKSLLVTVN